MTSENTEDAQRVELLDSSRTFPTLVWLHRAESLADCQKEKELFLPDRSKSRVPQSFVQCRNVFVLNFHATRL